MHDFGHPGEGVGKLLITNTEIRHGSKSNSRHPRYGTRVAPTSSPTPEETQWRTWSPESVPGLAYPWCGWESWIGKTDQKF